MIACIVETARRFSLPARATNGASLWGGHALRRAGVQFYGSCGVEIWRIQAQARHSNGAATILRYLGDSHV
eukprot:11206473-Lingulodinium_polyedra.AAC.1